MLCIHNMFEKHVFCFMVLIAFSQVGKNHIVLNIYKCLEVVIQVLFIQTRHLIEGLRATMC